MKRTLVLTAVAVAALAAVAASAQTATDTPGKWHHHHGPMMGAGPGRLIPLLMRSTDMTADQDAKAHQILDADRPAMEQLFGQLAQANKDLANLILGQDVKPAAITAQQAVVTQLQQQVAQHETNTVMAIRALLTPDQLTKASAARDEWQANHMGKHSCGPTAD